VGGVLVIAQVLDPDGRLVVLSFERWMHIVEPEMGRRGHPELRGRQDDIVAAVTSPDERRLGREPGEEWFLRRVDIPSRWLQVVVAFDGDVGFIVTAFPRRRRP